MVNLSNNIGDDGYCERLCMNTIR